MGGSVTWRPDRRRAVIVVYWQGKRYSIYRDPKNREPFDSKERALRWLHILQGEITQGVFNPRAWLPESPLSVRAYSRAWLQSISVSKTTLRHYRTYFERHINPLIGDMDIRHIRHVHLATIKKSLSVAEKTAFNILGALKTMLKYAYQNEDIQRMPPFPPLGYTRKPIEYLTIEQQEMVLAQIPERDKPIFQFMMELGCRVGEALALKQDCITEKTVIIRRAFSDNDLRERTKTGLIREEIITPYLSAVLSSITRHLGEFVFVRSDGLPYTNKNLNSIWRAACSAVGLKIKLYNACRHSLGSQLAAAGVDINVIRQALGHTDIRSTLIYAQGSKQVVARAREQRRAQVVDIKEAK